MKLRMISLGLLASLALTSMEVHGTDAQLKAMKQGPALQKEAAEVKRKAAKRLDVRAHHGDTMAALKAANDAVGGTGASINERINDVNTLLGAGGAAHGAPAAGDTHTKVTHILVRLKGLSAKIEAFATAGTDPTQAQANAANAAASIEDWLAAMNS